MKRLLFFPSWWLRLAIFPFTGRFFALCNGVLQGFVVEILRLEHKLFRIQKLRLEPCPSRLFSGHPMVLKEAAGSKGGGSEDTDPAYFLAAHQWAQTKIQTDCYADCKQGTDKLPGGKSKKDGLLIIPDFLWYFYFYIASLLLQ